MRASTETTGYFVEGFSLLEVIVATIIFTLVIGAAYALFDSARAMSDRATLQAEIQQEARVVLETLRADLRGACGSGTVFDTGFVGSQAGGDETPLYKLDLVSVNNVTNRAQTPEIDITRTSYYVDEEPSTKQMGLVRRKQKQLTNLTTVLRQDEGLEEIGPGVAYVRFRYWDGTSWAEVWDSTRSNTLPKAVEITIHIGSQWKTDYSLDKFSTRVYLPIAAETPQKNK